MKFFLSFLILSCFLSSVFSQTTTEITADTTLANEYFVQAESSENPDSLKIALLEKAVQLYEKHQVVEKLIRAKGLLVYLKNDYF